ncbi:putative NAD-dependent DNA ligase, subunit B [Erwinia phage KEY]|uniref:NAD-dependent DNA ligase, subunit B n=1 Tax=Erwinia phage KEY TaxID=2821255 RepID=A0AAE7WBL1_9CAUD|nr:putative NAD-dependent DNA ligase, subunit B [Erwinia phage KEY]
MRNEMKINIPSNCPSCGSKLELLNAQLFCRNTELCPAQNSKIIENFCSKMKLKGFGPSTIEKLQIIGIGEMLYLTLADIQEVMGEKMAAKLYAELEAKLHQNIDFGQFLGSLSIPLIGEVAARKIAQKYNSLSEAQADGKAGENLKAWKNSPIGKEVMAAQWNFSRARETSVNPDAENLNIAVCITGSLVDFKNRSDASSYLESLGLTVKKSVTKDVKYLILEDESKRSSSSTLKAISNGVEIVTINQLKEIIGK